MAEVRAPVHVTGEIVASRRAGAYRLLTIAAPGIPERFRAGNVVSLTIPGHQARRSMWIHKVRASGSFGPTLDIVVAPSGDATRWLAEQPVGTKVPVTGPLGRPFALPRDPVACLLVGERHHAAPLFPLAERLRERGCAVTLAVAAPGESELLSALEARRSVGSVVVITEDGSVGIRGRVAEHVDDLLARTRAEVVYCSASQAVAQEVALAAETRETWCQVALEIPSPCGTGLCHGCALPVVGEDGVARSVRACTEGPVLRADRIRWAAL